MICLEKNTVNNIILRLDKVTTLSSPNYLLQFISDFNNSISYVSVVDVSNSSCAYNEFNIIETGATYQLSASTINLKAGQYTVNVFESSSPTSNLSATTGVIIYTDIARVSGVDNTINSIYR